MAQLLVPHPLPPPDPAVIPPSPAQLEELPPLSLFARIPARLNVEPQTRSWRGMIKIPALQCRRWRTARTVPALQSMSMGSLGVMEQSLSVLSEKPAEKAELLLFFCTN